MNCVIHAKLLSFLNIFCFGGGGGGWGWGGSVSYSETF